MFRNDNLQLIDKSSICMVESDMVVYVFEGRGSMSIIRSVLIEELERNQEMQKSYAEQIEALPKGKIVLKKIKNRKYYYLLYRDHEKVKTDYLGPEDKFETQEIQEKIDKRRYFKETLNKLQLEEKEIRKAIR